MIAQTISHDHIFERSCVASAMPRMCTHSGAPTVCGLVASNVGFPRDSRRILRTYPESALSVMHFRVRNCPFESQTLFPDLTQNRTIALCTSSWLDLMDVVESAAPNPPLCRLST